MKIREGNVVCICGRRGERGDFEICDDNKDSKA